MTSDVLRAILTYLPSSVNKVLSKSKFSKNFINISWSSNQIFFTYFFLERFDQIRTLKNDFETQNFEIFDRVVHNFGKPDEVSIRDVPGVSKYPCYKREKFLCELHVHTSFIVSSKNAFVL